MTMTMTGEEAQLQQSAAQQAWLKTNALAALAKAYGPQYGDPDSVDKAAQAQTREATLPYAAPEAAATVQKTQADVAQAQAEAAQKQQAVQRGNLFNIGKLLQKPDGSVDTSLLDNPTIQQYGGLTAEQAAGIKQSLSGPDGPARLQSFLAAGVGPAGSMLTGGATVGVGPDGNMTIYRQTKSGELRGAPLPTGTVTPQEQNAQSGQGRLALQREIQPERVSIAQQNANTAAYSAGTRSQNSTYGAAPGTALPTQRGAMPQDRGATTDAIHGAPLSYIDSLPPKGRQMALSAAQSVVNANTMLGNTNKIIDVADKQIGAFTTGPGGELAHLPGTAATDLAHNLLTVKANVAQAVLTSMKGANGQTGIGRILQSEYQNFQQVLGAVDPTQSAGAVRFHLGLVRQSLGRLNQTLNDTYKAQWKTDPYTALGERNPSAAPSKPPPGLHLPPGFKYIGPAQ